MPWWRRLLRTRRSAPSAVTTEAAPRRVAELLEQLERRIDAQEHTLQVARRRIADLEVTIRMLGAERSTEHRQMQSELAAFVDHATLDLQRTRGEIQRLRLRLDVADARIELHRLDDHLEDACRQAGDMLDGISSMLLSAEARASALDEVDALAPDGSS